MEKPGKHHEYLKLMAGTWDVKSKMYMVPGQVMKGSYVETARMQPGGFWLISNIKGKVMDMPFHSHAVLGYEAHKKQYSGIWVDSLASILVHSTGHSERNGRLNIMIGKGYDPMQKRNVTMKQITEIKDANTKVFKMFDVQGKKVLVHFLGWNSKFDEWYTKKSPKLAPAKWPGGAKKRAAEGAAPTSDSKNCPACRGRHTAHTCGRGKDSARGASSGKKAAGATKAAAPMVEVVVAAVVAAAAACTAARSMGNGSTRSRRLVWTCSRRWTGRKGRRLPRRSGRLNRGARATPATTSPVSAPHRRHSSSRSLAIAAAGRRLARHRAPTRERGAREHRAPERLLRLAITKRITSGD